MRDWFDLFTHICSLRNFEKVHLSKVGKGKEFFAKRRKGQVFDEDWDEIPALNCDLHWLVHF